MIPMMSLSHEPHTDIQKVKMYGEVKMPRENYRFQHKCPIFFEDGDPLPYDIPSKFYTDDYVNHRCEIIARILPPKIVGDRAYRKLIVIRMRRCE
jgi:hypothetical protein